MARFWVIPIFVALSSLNALQILMKYILLFFLTLIIISSWSCNKDKDILPAATIPGTEEEWSIPLSEVIAAQNKDDIPAINVPVYLTADSAASLLNDDDLILGYVKGAFKIAYPIKVLNYHEVINDRVGNAPITITYSALTGSGSVFTADPLLVFTTYGTSGLIHKSNSILYDEASGTLWSQFLRKGIYGPGKDIEQPYEGLIETTWATWKRWYPETKVVTFKGTPQPDYTVYPYGNYQNSQDSLLYPMVLNSISYPNKQKILGMVLDTSVIYTAYNEFANTRVIGKQLDGKEVLIFGSESEQYMTAFYAETEDGESINVNKAADDLSLGVLFVDTNGTEWDITGLAISGRNLGDRLKRPTNFMAYAFAWKAFYPSSNL